MSVKWKPPTGLREQPRTWTWTAVIDTLIWAAILYGAIRFIEGGLPQ